MEAVVKYFVVHNFVLNFDSYTGSMIHNYYLYEKNGQMPSYVEKDPTKFCTYEEFQTGISTLKEFCLLRAESVSGQLNGVIGSTADTQESDTLIDAGDIKISDMGAMDHSRGNDR